MCATPATGYRPPATEYRIRRHRPPLRSATPPSSFQSMRNRTRCRYAVFEFSATPTRRGAARREEGSFYRVGRLLFLRLRHSSKPIRSTRRLFIFSAVRRVVVIDQDLLVSLPSPLTPPSAILLDAVRILIITLGGNSEKRNRKARVDRIRYYGARANRKRAGKFAHAVYNSRARS